MLKVSFYNVNVEDYDIMADKLADMSSALPRRFNSKSAMITGIKRSTKQTTSRFICMDKLFDTPTIEYDRDKGITVLAAYNKCKSSKNTINFMLIYYEDNNDFIPVVTRMFDDISVGTDVVRLRFEIKTELLEPYVESYMPKS